MQNNRCGHFSLQVEELHVADASVMLRVPIRRCALAEHMISVLVSTTEGAALAKKLLVTMVGSVGTDTGSFDTSKIVVAFGPDLESIHPMECTVGRCKESCTPGYRSILFQYGFTDEAERENGKGCLDLEGRDTEAPTITPAR
jgi:hypothetical protein